MIVIEFKGKDYELPTRFSEIKLNTYMKIIEINKDLNDTDRLMEMISIFTGIPAEDVRRINIDQIVLISNSLKFMFTNNKHTITEQIKVNEKWYGLNPDIQNMSFGEFIDLEELTKEKDIEALDVLMAILYRPLKRKHKLSKLSTFIDRYIYNKEKDTDYQIEDYDSDTVTNRALIFKEHMTMDVAMGALFFFTILRVLHERNTLSSSNNQTMKTEMLKMIKDLQLTFIASGDG